MTSCSCYPFLNKTRNLSLLPLGTVSASHGPFPSSAPINLNRKRNLSLHSLWTFSARQASIPGLLLGGVTVVLDCELRGVLLWRLLVVGDLGLGRFGLYVLLGGSLVFMQQLCCVLRWLCINVLDHLSFIFSGNPLDGNHLLGVL